MFGNGPLKTGTKRFYSDQRFEAIYLKRKSTVASVSLEVESFGGGNQLTMPLGIAGVENVVVGKCQVLLFRCLKSKLWVLPPPSPPLINIVDSFLGRIQERLEKQKHLNTEFNALLMESLGIQCG